MQESCSYGSVGEREGNDPLYPESVPYARGASMVRLRESAWEGFILSIENTGRLYGAIKSR